jgi:hypothetical protein
MVHGKAFGLNYLENAQESGIAEWNNTKEGARGAGRLTQIDADTEKKSLSSASICVICGQTLFFLKNFKQEHTEVTELERGVFLCALGALLFNPSFPPPPQ